MELGLLQPHEVEEAVATRFSSVRVGVAGRAELSLQGVMDCGVCPATLLALLARWGGGACGAVQAGRLYGQPPQLCLLLLQCSGCSQH